VLLFTPEREHLLHLRQVTRHAPDLAIEILSPATARNDRGRKLRLYEQHRVSEYWLVDPGGASVEIYRLADGRLIPAAIATGDQPIESPLLPALALRPSDLVPTPSQ
jgi:Uma2 family endonuclease